MSSKILYPPIVDSYMPAFIASANPPRIYFSLSKFNGSGDFSSVHAVVTDQATGRNVLKSQKYSATGILLNLVPATVEDQDNLYYIEIPSSSLEQGWQADRIYKVQLRLSVNSYNGTDNEAQWLYNESANFSEWSTVCILKAISPINYSLPALGIDTSIENQGNVIEDIYTYYSSTLTLAGSFIRQPDSTELVHSYCFTLYDEDNNFIESSGDIYTNKYVNTDSFTYTFDTELQNDHKYNLAFKFITVNKYEGGFYEEDERYNFTCSIYAIDEPNCKLISIENDERLVIDNTQGETRYINTQHPHLEFPNPLSPVLSNEESREPEVRLGPWIMADVLETSIDKEEDEGRIAIKFVKDGGDDIRSGNYCIRRASSRDNFKTWTDVFVYVAKSVDIADFPTFYDYTIESGVWYKYGVQVIKSNGDRGILRIMTNPILRNFNYTFLLGQNNQQLKLKFDNTMPNFKYQIYDSQSDPIGSQYTNISRNANTCYRTFPVNGLISFNMDENKLFIDKTKIYSEAENLYNQYNEKNNIDYYDYIYEREFRSKVLEFLQDGELKLYKSPTEGNIIVRLKDVNCVPNQTLDRMVYSFSAVASEMDEATMKNYKKYGFYTVSDYESSFAVYETKLGQITGNVPVGPSSNIFSMILKKYGDGTQNIAGSSKRVTKIHHIKITFNDKPLRIDNGNEIVIGNKFNIKGTDITVTNPQRVYEFDSRLSYTPSEKLFLYGDAEGRVSSIDITIDFLYDLETDVYNPNEVQSRSIKRGIGQFYQNCTPNENIYSEIYLKYYMDWKDQFLRLNQLSSIMIEANPGAAFSIKDASDTNPDVHVIGATGLLELFDLENISDIKYLGMQNSSTGVIEAKNTDVMLNYIYIVTKGIYKIKASN